MQEMADRRFVSLSDVIREACVQYAKERRRTPMPAERKPHSALVCFERRQSNRPSSTSQPAEISIEGSESAWKADVRR